MMRKIYAALLALLLVVLQWPHLPAQAVPRYFPAVPPAQYYHTVNIAPVLRMLDGGYLLDFGYGGPNIHGPVYAGEIIRTDSAWTPLWKIHQYQRSGLGNFIFADTTILHVGYSGILKVRHDGTEIWTKFLNRPTNYGNEFVQAHDRSGDIVCTGSTFQRDWLGSNIYESPIQVAIDTAGNVLWTDSLVIAGDIYTHITSADNDAGGTWLLGSSANPTPGSSYAFIAKVDTAHNVAFANKLIGVSSGTAEVIDVLANGDAVVGGRIINQSAAGSSIFIARYSPAGSQLWVQQIDSAFNVSSFHELPGGDVLVMCSGLNATGQQTLPVALRMTPSGSVVWARAANFSGSAFGPPMSLGSNAWLIPTMGDDPMILETDTLMQSNSCPLRSLQVNTTPLTLGTAPVTMQVFPHTLTVGVGISDPHQLQIYVDSCASLPLAVQPAVPVALEVFPNPSHGRLKVRADRGIRSIRVIDALGREVAGCNPHATFATLDLDVSGPCWLQVEMEDGQQLARLVTLMR